jgi:hypothetical protein
VDRVDAPAEAVARFEDLDGEARARQAIRRGEAGRACAEDEDVGLHERMIIGRRVEWNGQKGSPGAHDSACNAHGVAVTMPGTWRHFDGRRD